MEHAGRQMLTIICTLTKIAYLLNIEIISILKNVTAE
jgi:hypothetical protein